MLHAVLIGLWAENVDIAGQNVDTNLQMEDETVVCLEDSPEHVDMQVHEISVQEMAGTQAVQGVSFHMTDNEEPTAKKCLFLHLPSISESNNSKSHTVTATLTMAASLSSGGVLTLNTKLVRRRQRRNK